MGRFFAEKAYRCRRTVILYRGEAVIGKGVREPKRLYFPASEADISKRMKQFAGTEPRSSGSLDSRFGKKRWQKSK